MPVGRRPTRRETTVVDPELGRDAMYAAIRRVALLSGDLADQGRATATSSDAQDQGGGGAGQWARSVANDGHFEEVSPDQPTRAHALDVEGLETDAVGRSFEDGHIARCERQYQGKPALGRSERNLAEQIGGLGTVLELVVRGCERRDRQS